MMDTTYLILYSANLTFILTNLYGWLLKWFYRPKAYDEHFHELFPAQRSVGALYLMQLFELPYLLHIGDANALLYVNAFAVLVFSLQMLVMCEGYFFPAIKHSAREYWIYLPAIFVLLPLFLQALGLFTLPEGHRQWTFVVVTAVFIPYLWLSVRMALRIGQGIRQANEATYADTDDFPVRFAQYIQWVPTGICVLMVLNFYADHPTVKAVRDVFFTGVNIWFCVFTLNPWRESFAVGGRLHEPTVSLADEQESVMQARELSDASFRLSDDRYADLSQRLETLLTVEHVFTESHLRLDAIAANLGTNTKYLTEVIQRKGYSSFYDMICQHRVRHAISLIRQHPDLRLFDIAHDCGFSSPSSMTKAFASQGKQSPSFYRRIK